jgi:hypothetical protein
LERDAKLNLLNKLVGTEIKFVNPDVRIASLGYAISYHSDRLPALFSGNLLKDSETSYPGTGSNIDDRSDLDKQYDQKNRGPNSPDLSELTVNLNLVREILQSDVLTAPQKDAIRVVSGASEWLVLNGPKLQQFVASDSFSLPDVAVCRDRQSA